jgi:hypothetical protein
VFFIKNWESGIFNRREGGLSIQNDLICFDKIEEAYIEYIKVNYNPAARYAADAAARPVCVRKRGKRKR